MLEISDEQDVILQLRLEDMSKELRYAMEMRRKNEMKILKLQKKVLLYKNELDCTLQKLEAEKVCDQTESSLNHVSQLVRLGGFKLDFYSYTSRLRVSLCDDF
ncbi:hypothetical protein AHF37_10199 [Paragonimus kellicotti]|nr:hypothetical protein AHF37_10199 [Paragonimus kellicotti]